MVTIKSLSILIKAGQDEGAIQDGILFWDAPFVSIPQVS